jgi:hypothetical protein
MKATFDRSFIGLIKNETTLVVDTITNVQSVLNRNSNPTDQRPLVPSTELPFFIHICCCCFFVVIILLIVVSVKYVIQRQQVTKPKHSKVIKMFFYFYLNVSHYLFLKINSTSARPFEYVIVMNPPDDSAQSSQVF